MVLKKTMRKVSWEKKSFTEKPDPAPAAVTPPRDVCSPLIYFIHYFNDHFFENASEKTSMYHMSQTENASRVTPHTIKQLFGLCIIHG